MILPDMTDAELEDLKERTQAYVDALHDFAQDEAVRQNIPVRVAIPAALGWALAIARFAGISLTSVDLEAFPEARENQTQH